MREDTALDPEAALDPLVFSRDKRPNQEQRDEYLRLRCEGRSHGEAAKAVGSTGTAFRRLTNKDPEFAQLRHLAEQMQKEALPDRIRASLFSRAFDLGDPKSFEALKMLAEIYLPETDFKRTRRTEVSGDLTHHLQVSAEQLAQMPQSELEHLVATLEKLHAQPVRAPLQLAAGD